MSTPTGWQPLIEGLIEAVLIVGGPDHRILAANRNAADLLHVDREALIGRPVRDFAAAPEDIFFWEEAVGGVPEDILSATLLRRPDGSTLHVDRRISRVVTSPDHVVYVVGLTDQSERRRIDDEFERIVAELRATLESTAEGILVVDLNGGIRSYNQRFAELWDIPHALMTRRDDAAIHAWLAQNVIDAGDYSERLMALARSPLQEATDLVVLRSGHVLERVSLPQYARGRPIGRVYSFRDITQRLAAESRLKLAARVFASSLDAIVITDATGRVVATNPQSWRLSGYSERELLDRRIGDLLYQPEDEGFLPRLRQRLQDDGYWEGEIWHRKKDGSSCPVLSSFVRVLDDQSSDPQYVVFFKDLTERMAAARRIEELAYHDVLTGLPNRTLLGERIEFALAWAAREEKAFAVLFIDLDRFKQINDSLGHQAGDRVLVEVAERIRRCLRQCDTAARLGGDEFLLLLLEVDMLGAEAIAQRLIAALEKPFALDGLDLTVSCSIGIALYPDDGRSADELVKHADAAMYQVKDHGRGDFGFYQPQMNVDLLARMRLDQAMRKALAQGGFELLFQPQARIDSGRIVAAEALLRWRDAELGEIAPEQFIALAEETGFIVSLGDWALNEAVRQAAAWRREGVEMVVAVTVSALQFRKADFVQSVSNALRRADLAPGALELELTERILTLDPDDALSRLRALAELGVRLSIDDFGTGYSSLGYLKRYPIHKLKIHGAFIGGLPEDAGDAAIVSAIIGLGHALGLDIVACGVETESQRAFLGRAGCDLCQGFLQSPPVDAAAFGRLVREVADASL